MNSCNFIGRVGKDAESRFTPSGKPVLSWSLAVDSGFGDAKQTLWLDCALWGDRGEILAQYVTKGSRLGVTGELGTREHEGKTYLRLNVRDVTLCGGKREESGAGKTHSAQPRKPPTSALDDDGDSIPF